MKVKELINYLKNLDQDLPVYRVNNGSEEGLDTEYEVTDIDVTTHLTYNKHQDNIVMTAAGNPRKHHTRRRGAGYYLRNIVLIK